jgi:acyl dehydratase
MGGVCRLVLFLSSVFICVNLWFLFMPKRHFDEIEIGESFETPGITVTDWHVLQFAGVSMDFFELHTNDEFARQTEFGRRVAHGLLGLALTDGLKNRSAFQVHALASLHWSWDFVGPIFIGDTISAQLRVEDKRASRSKPDRGVVTLALELRNQHGKIVQQGKNVLLVARKMAVGTEKAG